MSQVNCSQHAAKHCPWRLTQTNWLNKKMG